MRRLLLLALLLVIPGFSHAQIDLSGSTDTSLFIESTPSYPQPNQEFTLKLNDYASNVFGSTIEWYVNGSPLNWAYNQRSITLTAPEAGAIADVKVVLTKPNGGTETTSRQFEPIYVDIILEPQTHVPNFFRGRALPTPFSTVNATALLSNNTLLDTEYSYTWRLNDRVLEGGPLRGGNRVSFIMPQDSYSTLSLTVSNLNGTIVTRQSIAIPVAKPKLLFYEVSTLYGTIQRAINESIPLLGNSMTIIAAPYYLDSEVFNNPSVLEWRINRVKAATGPNPYELTIERTGTSGAVDMSFRVQSTTKLLQGVTDEIVIDVL